MKLQEDGHLARLKKGTVEGEMWKVKYGRWEVGKAKKP
jgi:hypothetical protein